MLNTNVLQKLQQDAVVSLYSLIIFVLMNSQLAQVWSKARAYSMIKSIKAKKSY